MKGVELEISVLRAAKQGDGPVRKLVLAKGVEDLVGLDPRQDGLVVYFTDWLSWIAWRENGGRAVHAESYLPDWPQELGEQDDYQRRAVTWMYCQGRDATLFNGVSLGKQFNWEVTGVRLAADRLRASLARALTELSPGEIEYRGLRAEYDFLDRETLWDIADSVASRHGQTLTRIKPSPDQPPGLDPELPFNGEFQPPSWRRRTALRFAELAIDWTSRLLSVVRPKIPRVFLLHNPLVVSSLIEHLPTGQAAPVLLASTHPKRPSFLLPAWRKGVRLVALSRPRIADKDKRRLQEIRDWMSEKVENRPLDPGERATLRFLAQNVLGNRGLEDKAAEILQYLRLFKSEAPSRILVGDSENRLVRLTCEIAQSLGIAVDELPNGMFLTGQRMDSRSGDGFRAPVIDRLLGWGDSNLAWARRAQVAVPVELTGYPVADNLTKAPPPANAGRALILPLHVDKTDLCGLYSEVFANLVHAARIAKRSGYSDIRIKVHPGFIHLPYYKAVADKFGLNALVVKDGSLLPHIAWSDIVIGPINSGAMIEAAAMGRPYIPVLNPPSAIEPGLAKSARSVSPAELESAIASLDVNDDSKLLAEIAGRRSDESAGRRVWAAISSKIGPSACRTCA